MTRATIAAVGLACALASCLGTMDEAAPLGIASGELAAENAHGAIPVGLPARMLARVFENTGGTWMRNSGVAWSARYRAPVQHEQRAWLGTRSSRLSAARPSTSS